MFSHLDQEERITIAYLSHGRWVIDCPNCNLGYVVHIESPFAIFDAKNTPFSNCIKCGWKPTAVQFPAEYPEICRLTSLRPKEINRNWRPPETIFDLRIENAAHGVTS